MSDLVFNISKGAVAEKFRDGAANGLMLFLKVAQADATLVDHDTVASILAAANTEADFTNYVRKVGLTGTITVDDTNDRVDVDMPDQTWTAAGGATNNTLVKLVIAYEESASDAGRVPLTNHDSAYTTTGINLTVSLNAAGFFRAS